MFTATQQEYPLSEATRNDLRQQQQRLGLTDVDIAPIEAQITTQIESYHQKLQQYEQAFVKATQRQHYPDEVTRKQLQQTWQTLGLSERDVGAIERRINAEIQTYQGNLRQYEQEFTEGVQQEYPLSAFKRSQLTQRHQALNLTAENVTAIENPIVAAIEEHQQKLQQYEQVFRESMQFEYPLSDATREELQRFQDILELSAQEVAQIEAESIEKSKAIVEVLPQYSEDLKSEYKFTSSKLVKRLVWGVPVSFILIIAAGYYYSSSSSDQHTIERQKNQRINENTVLTWAKNYQLEKQFEECAKLMLERVDFFSELDNKIASQFLLRECQSSLKEESVANAQKFQQKLDLILKNPKPAVPELYISTLTYQQVISLNALYAKFVQVAPDSSNVKPGIAAKYEEWQGLCIGTGTSWCKFSLAAEIVNHKNLFADYRLVTSGGWIIYKF